MPLKVGHLIKMLVAAAALTTAAGAEPPPAKIALTGGRIIPVVGDEMENGTILIERGKIVAVGTDVEIPYDAMELDCTGKVLMPGMIDPTSSSGLDRANETQPVLPFLDVADAIDPSRSFFEDALRDGVTSIHVIQGNSCVIGGISRVVRPIGLTVNEMTVAADVALKMSASPTMSGFDRMKQAATMRETFIELDEYLANLAERKYEEKLAKDEKDIDVGPAEARERGKALIKETDYDDQHRNLIRLRRGDVGAFMYVGSPTDVKNAVATATEQKFLEHTVFVLGTDTYRAMGELTRASRPVVLDANLYHRERDPITRELKEVFIPRKIYDAGLMFALQPNPGGSMAESYLNYQAAVCVRNGIPRQAALEAITINPAKMLGLGERLGSIEVGKAANIVVMTGDPLDFNSWVDQVIVDGVVAYERSTDPRLQKLLDLGQRAKEAAEQQKAEAAEPTEAETETETGEGDDEGKADASGDGGGDGGDEG